MNKAVLLLKEIALKQCILCVIIIYKSQEIWYDLQVPVYISAGRVTMRESICGCMLRRVAVYAAGFVKRNACWQEPPGVPRIYCY